MSKVYVDKVIDVRIEHGDLGEEFPYILKIDDRSLPKFCKHCESNKLQPFEYIKVYLDKVFTNLDEMGFEIVKKKVVK